MQEVVPLMDPTFTLSTWKQKHFSENVKQCPFEFHIYTYVHTWHVTE